MKLKNKETGEIVDLLEGDLRGVRCGEQIVVKPVAALGREYVYNSLAELCEEWEDYREPKELYIVDARHECCVGILNIEENPEWCARLIELGLGFETKEEAEIAVNKLKTFKALTDKEFKFNSWKFTPNFDRPDRIAIAAEGKVGFDDFKYLNFLFLGEEK